MWIKEANENGRGGNDKDVLISTNSILLARESRFALRHDPESTTYTLQVSRGTGRGGGGGLACLVTEYV